MSKHISGFHRRHGRGLPVVRYSIYSVVLIFSSLLFLRPSSAMQNSADWISQIEAEVESERPKKIMEVMCRQRSELQSKTIRLLTSSSAFRSGGLQYTSELNPERKSDFEGVQRSEFVIAVDRLFYESPDLLSRTGPLQKVTFDGQRTKLYKLTNSTRVLSLDIYCYRPLMHEVVIPFVEATGLSCFGDQAGRLEMTEVFGRCLECKWNGVIDHPQLGKAIVLAKKQKLAGGTSETRLMFGERFGQLVYLGSETVSLSDPNNHPEGLHQRELFSLYLDYDTSTGMVLPDEWKRVSSTAIGELSELDSVTPIINSAVRTTVTKCEVLDEFPQRYLKVKIQNDTRVNDHCDPDRRFAATEEVGGKDPFSHDPISGDVAPVISPSNKNGYGMWFIAAGGLALVVLATTHIMSKSRSTV